jgi:Tol biopolymer transport system component
MNLDHEVAREYLDSGAQSLDAAQRAALSAHVADCEDCRAYGEQVAALGAMLRGALDARWGQGPDSLRSTLAIQKRLRRRAMLKQTYALAGSLAGLAGLVVLAVLLGGWLSRQATTPPMIYPGGAGTQLGVGRMATLPATSATVPATDTAMASVGWLPLTPTTSLPAAAPAPMVTLAPGGESVPASAQRLAFETNRDGNWEVYLWARGLVQNLTHNPANDGGPLWSLDGQSLLFTSDRTGQTEYFVMGADGSQVRQVTHESQAGVSFGPGAWSPDGQWLAGIASSAEPPQDQIRLVAVKGDQPDRLLAWSDGLGASATMTETSIVSPQWSPDGAYLAFQFCHRATCQIVLTSPGHGPQAVSLNSCQGVGPNALAWSPDGKRLACFSAAGTDDVALRQVSLTIFRVEALDHVMPETSVKLLADILFRLYGNLAWSPDGRRLLFTVDWQGLQLYQLYVVNADGTGLTRLGDNLDFASPVWSPDGEWIAFSRRLDLGVENVDIDQINVKQALQQPGGVAISRVTTGGANFHPQWQTRPRLP